ncbi:LPP20 family lipoprotein [Sulfuricurvum sp.]|uniref:LPP20 family lipoprotein n=1 Tax=Sulfuricurvum sp. TaxID=2025608 RepID=UPI001994E529|nr:LPP20 family lipoprotein [Sulfuricurvum sp.]MBD3806908.1 LPP20 family lipoprotein [Sulfuricurvum sp.]
MITVIGQGVAPSITASPAQAYALAKRSAIVDGYRQIAEKVAGVHVEGQDSIKNMMLASSSTRTWVEAFIRGANITNTTFKDGLCEVEMEIALSYSRLLH